MIVVADTSVILNLCRIQHEHLLPPLFGRVLIPHEVATEFVRLAGVDVRFAGLQLPAWIEQMTAPPHRRSSFRRTSTQGDGGNFPLPRQLC